MKFDPVLVIDPNGSNAKMLANLLRGINPTCKIYGAATPPKAMALAREVVPKLIFVESVGPDLDGIQLARDLRRSELACREAAMIMVSQETTAALILGARDAGVHEFLRRPYTMGDLQKRMEAVSKPRDWVEGIRYIGPDRRRFNSADYSGPRKRRSDGSPKIDKINRAIRIVQSCAVSADTDPVQAMRALNTQARILIEASGGVEPYKQLGAVAAGLQTYLAGPALQNGLTKSMVEAIAAKLVALAPQDPAKTDAQTRAA